MTTHTLVSLIFSALTAAMVIGGIVFVLSHADRGYESEGEER